MESLNELHPNDLFRFMNVRGPLKQSEEPSAQLFVMNVYDDASNARLAPDSSNLYPDLLSYRGLADQLKKSVERVASYKKSKSYFSNPDLITAAYPALSAFIDWVDTNAEQAELKKLTDSYHRITGKTVDEFVASKEFTLGQMLFWDNLFANLLSANNAFLITLCCKYLGTLNMLEVVSTQKAKDLPKTPGIIYRSKPLVPKWFFEISALLNINADEDVDSQQSPPDNEAALRKSRYLLLVNAAAELRNVFERKYKTALEKQEKESLKFDELKAGFADKQTPASTQTGAIANRLYKSVDSALLLAADDISRLTAETRRIVSDLLGESESYAIDQLLRLIREEITPLGSKIGEESQARAIKVGNSIISSEDFCADMIDKDPCGRGPRKDFYSKGSFVTSSLIGDLLVTKQQLVKYDLGEVAHVETAMTGIEKERIHRRLHRTEEFTLSESETITENERESQTTDRYDMEKESSKVLEQNFQLDAGINVSGSYGTVQFTSSLDTSFGSSSAVAQSEATSFSKSVTTRALSRVKERVRTLKTLTVINEVEETSSNKLTNTSGDNVNGVYRWLDKFYLNKIINYGKRLMFEFTIPEPANFYIFRQMVKPKVNNSVLQPADPKTTNDPQGGSLRTPTDITELNYTFWASLYGASGIDAPPVPFIRTSRSWKNEYGTSQSGDIYDSFNTTFEIEQNYEAILAQVQCAGFWWGGWALTGMVGTTGFGVGYTIINLPGIRNTLGVTLLSMGMNFRLNLIVTAQRGAELYAQWQINTFNKIMDAYNSRKREYESWLEDQAEGIAQPFAINSNNPGVNRETEREELKKRCLEMFTGQRFESFDAAVNGIYNVSGYPEILFNEAIREGNVVKFFEQAFDWANMTYIYYPYMWGRKNNWLTTKLIEDPSDPLFTKFLQAGYARVVVPVRPDFENYLMVFHMLSQIISAFGCSWNFQPSVFGQLGISNSFIPGVNDPVYVSVATELQNAAGYSEETGPIYGTPYLQKVPTNLVYIAQNSHLPGSPWPGLPDNSADPDIAPYI